MYVCGFAASASVTMIDDCFFYAKVIIEFRRELISCLSIQILIRVLIQIACRKAMTLSSN